LYVFPEKLIVLASGDTFSATELEVLGANSATPA
jgi:hypothetical protein